MKRIFYTLSITLTIAVVMMACSNSPKAVDESGKTLTYADTVGLAEFQEWKAHNERLAAIDAYKKANERYTAPAVRRSPAKQSGTMVSSSENQAKVAEKKGWSKAAKGATIGAGSGAILGAVIHKRNRALGAVIGGVVGGGVGYGIGRSKDKKDGRY
ncbi:MAG TPA: YMGG-like glycine zipper-containing protein [Chitinophagaceae bacterium]|nr:YMGG-like glycine zipper-containing protein [Chitinophagaceae bacterium]